MRLRSLVAFTLGALTAAGCGALLAAKAGGGHARIEAVAPAGAVPWTGLEPLGDDAEFRFTVVTDRTGEHRDGVFEGAMPKLNLVRPEFVMSVGDLIEGYTDDRAVLGRQWDEIERFVGALQMPFFYAPGNHDMSNAVMAEVWKERFGPSYYHFVYRDVLFLVLNSELFGMVHDPRQPLPGPWQQAEQMAYVERVLAENPNARWTFVFLHQPLWDRPKVGPASAIHPDWLRVEQLLGQRPYTVFAGHYHRYTEHVRNDRQYITLATTGGGSEMRGTVWGEFDHVAQVTMTKDGPVIANLRLDGILPHDVSTEAQRETVLRLANAVTTEPLVGNGKAFEAGVARFSIANPLAQPIEVEGRFEDGANVEIANTRVSRTLAAGAATTIEVPVRGTSRVPYESVAPAHAHWTLRTANGAGEPIEIETTSIVLPETRFGVGAARGVVVDGSLAEWGALPFQVDSPGELDGHGLYHGPDDLSFRFGVRRDADFVYVGVDVRDDSLVASADEVLREQDHVSVSLDPRPDPERSQNLDFRTAMTTGAFAKLITASAALGETREDPVMRLFASAAPKGMLAKTQRTASGYSAEIAVPASVLDERRGAAWDALRVNVTVNDFDASEPDHTSISWRPSRFGGRGAEGAGTFVR